MLQTKNQNVISVITLLTSGIVSEASEISKKTRKMNKSMQDMFLAVESELLKLIPEGTEYDAAKKLIQTRAGTLGYDKQNTPATFLYHMIAECFDKKQFSFNKQIRLEWKMGNLPFSESVGVITKTFEQLNIFWENQVKLEIDSQGLGYTITFHYFG